MWRGQCCAFSRALGHGERAGQAISSLRDGRRQGGSVFAYVINNSDMFPPPGLLDASNPVQYTETSSGGDEAWLAFTLKKLYTNAFIVSPGPPRKVAAVVKPWQTASYTQLTDFAWLQETWIWCTSVS